MRKWMILACLIALTGCAAQRQANFDKGVAVCRATIPAVVGSYARRQRCIVDASTQAGFHGPAEDMLNATRMELAEKVDAGKMTPAEANARYAQIRYDVSRQAEADGAQRAQAAAAILSAMPQPQPYVVPAYQMPVAQPWTATCTRMGAFTTCNGN